ncbi:TVP38/TMEM64 family protein [Paenibacillus sp. MAHUQ-46]|uniref:TVP38/TMEM64 family membrane protein n=2 Tax=Paenibacillus TaxID=44249 RepID=A0A934J4V2_9BACL|nr:TVP38/TMEM64 family protein [Paenibacillus roseus]MBJ6360455.1 TVP38/TMEM64 family protein [Paenibacillus roseus]
MKPEQLQGYLESFSALGPIPGIAAPFLESLLPFLPLLLLIAANANIYGLGPGILYSWIGVSSGCILIFWLSRKLGGGFRKWLQRKFPASARFFDWIESRGFTPIFLLACFPFSPSVLINIASGLTTVPMRTFATAILMGKGVMITSVSLLSFNIANVFDAPWRIVLAVSCLFLMWLLGKRLEMRFQT